MVLGTGQCSKNTSKLFQPFICFPRLTFFKFLFDNKSEECFLCCPGSAKTVQLGEKVNWSLFQPVHQRLSSGRCSSKVLVKVVIFDMI